MDTSITVWTDGTWKVWSSLDAYYAQEDADWLVTIPCAELADGT